MIRTQIQLPDEVYARAKRVCEAREIPLAELAPPHAERLRAIAARHGAELRDPAPDICGPGPVCAPLHEGAPKFADDKHLRPGFAARLTFLDDIWAAR